MRYQPSRLVLLHVFTLLSLVLNLVPSIAPRTFAAGSTTPTAPTSALLTPTISDPLVAPFVDPARAALGISDPALHSNVTLTRLEPLDWVAPAAPPRQESVSHLSNGAPQAAGLDQLTHQRASIAATDTLTPTDSSSTNASRAPPVTLTASTTTAPRNSALVAAPVVSTHAAHNSAASAPQTVLTSGNATKPVTATLALAQRVYLPLIQLGSASMSAPRDTVRVTPEQGGTLLSADGHLQLELPAGAVTRPVTVTYHTIVSSTTDGLQRVGSFFELTAIDADGQLVRHFAQPLTLRVRYADQPGLAEARLKLAFTDAEHPAWTAMPSTVDAQANQVVAQSDHFTEFVIIVGPPQGTITCNFAVDPAFDAAYQTTINAGEQPGCPTSDAADWNGAVTQFFVNNGVRSAIVAGYYVGPDYLNGYASAGGPSGILGLPTEHSFNASPAREFYKDENHDFVGQKIQYYERGFVGQDVKTGAWIGALNFPMVCPGTVGSEQRVQEEQDPKTGDILKTTRYFTYTVTTDAFPAPGANDRASFSAVQITPYLNQASIGAASMSLNGTQYTYTYFYSDNQPANAPNPEFSFMIAAIRANDGFMGYAPAINEPQSPLTANWACLGGLNPGGGGFSPPRDTTPPDISTPEIFQDGSGGVSVDTTITDNSGTVSEASLLIDGKATLMQANGDHFSGMVKALILGNHTLQITARDPSRNLGKWPKDGSLLVFKVEDSGVYGKVKWVGYSPDPINTLIGNFIYEYIDVVLLGAGPRMELRRFYNSQSGLVGLFGLGWTTLVDMRLRLVDNALLSGAQLRYPDGHTANFPAKGDGFARPLYGFDQLERDGDGYLLTRTDGTSYRFRVDGRLVQIADPSALVINLIYSGDSLSEIQAPGGTLAFRTDGKGRVTQVSGPNGVSLSYTYDDTGRLISVIDGNGGKVEYAYDPNNGLTKLTTPAGYNFVQEQRYDEQGRIIYQRTGENAINTFAYDDVNRTTTLTDTYGNTITYRYDDQRRLIAQTDAQGKSETFTYNDDNQVTSHTDRNGNITKYEYLDGNKVKEIDALGGVRTWVYDAHHHVIRATDQLGRSTQYEYDAQGRQTAVVDALNQRTVMRYNDQGLLIKRIGLRGDVTTYTYDAHGNLTAETDALGNTTYTTYDAQGRKLTQTDALGGVRSSTYDANGNLLSETDPLTHTTTYAYNANNARTAESDANGKTTNYTYSTLGKLLTTTRADGGVTTISYDDMGNKIAETDPLGHTRRWELDPLYRVSKAIDSTGATTTYTYDANGNQCTITDPRGFTTQIEYDALNREVRRTDALGGVTETTYDAAGSRTRVTAPNGATTDYTYDALNRVVKVTDALGVVTTTTYDAAGNRIAETDALGNTTQHTYDLLGREVATTDALGNVTRTAYDALGHVVAVTDANGAVTRSAYAADGQMIATTDALGGITQREYDAVGNLIATLDGLGFRTTLVYDAMNRAVAVTDALGGVTHSVYDLAGRRISVTDANGNSTSYAYDALGRTVTLTDALGFTVASVYDASGNLVKTIDQAGAVTSYEYDALNRKTRQVNALGFATTFAYDVMGNLVATTDANGAVTVTTYDLLNRTLTVTDALGYITRYSYDLLGHQTSSIYADGSTTITLYDALGRVISTTDGEGFTRNSAYDAVGNRVSTTDANGNTTTTSYDLLRRPVEQRDTIGLVQRLTYDAVGNVLASTDGNGNTTTVDYNALRRKVRVTDAEGHAATTLYDAVGNSTEETDGNGHRTTHTYDARNQRVATTDARGNTTNFSFDPVGHSLMTTDALGVLTLNRYDAVGQLVAVTLNYNASSLPNAQTNVTTSYVYDAVGNRVSITNPNGATVSFSADLLGHLVTETDPLSNTMRYRYDALGRQIERHEPNGNVVTTSYDRRGLALRVTYADGSAVTKRYDGNGHLIELHDTSGVTTFSYDARNRQTSERGPQGTVASLYDGANNRLALTYPDGRSVRYGYFRNNWLQTVVNPAAPDDDDRNGSDHQGADDDHASSASDTSGHDNHAEPVGTTTTYERDGIGQVLRQLNGNGTITTQTYDAANNLLSVETHQIDPSHQGDDNHQSDQSHLITAVAYRYDAVNQRTTTTFSYRDGGEHNLTENYRYDQLRRLVELRDSTGQVQSYAFDAASNRLRWRTSAAAHDDQPGPAIELAYRYDAADELLQVEQQVLTDNRDHDDGYDGTKPDDGGDHDDDDRAGDDQSRTVMQRYSYDANGNRVERSDEHSGVKYRYNGENHLVAAQDFALREDGQRKLGTLTGMAYDGLNRRVAQTISAAKSDDASTHDSSAQSNASSNDSSGGSNIQTRRYSYDGLNPIAFVAGQQPQATNLYRADGGRILLQDGTSDGQLWLTQDGLGSTIAATGANGAGGASYHYDPYGQATPREGDASLTYLFTGQEYDTSTGLYHFYARDYDPTTGTWLTRDPYRGTPTDPQSLHRYGYVKGNPVNLADLYGYKASKGHTGGVNTLINEFVWAIAQHDMQADLENLTGALGVNTVEVLTLDDISGALKDIKGHKLFQRSLVPGGLSNLPLKQGFDFYLNVMGSFDHYPQFEREPTGYVASYCFKLDGRVEGGFTLRAPNPLFAADVYGSVGAEAEGCVDVGVSYLQTTIEGKVMTYTGSRGAATLYGEFGGRAYLVADIGATGIRTGIRAAVRASKTWNLDSYNTSSLDNGIEVQIQVAPFVGYKHFSLWGWGNNKWDDTDLATFTWEHPFK